MTTPTLPQSPSTTAHEPRARSAAAPRLPRRTFLLALAALPACRSGAGDRASARERVVSLAPSTTETAFALGAGDLLVGRSRHCDHPPEAARLPAVGGYADPNVEAIVALAPTLVIGARGPAGPALEHALRARGIETFFPETESLDQIEAMIVALAARLHREADGRRVAQSLRAKRDAIAAAYAGRPRPRVLFLFDVAPIVAAGPGSFPDEMIRAAGAENAVTRGGAYPTLGIEHVLALDPDIVLDGSEGSHEPGGQSGVAALTAAPGWRELRALRTGRVRPLNASAALRPGPRIGEGLELVARAIHAPAP